MNKKLTFSVGALCALLSVDFLLPVDQVLIQSVSSDIMSVSFLPMICIDTAGIGVSVILFYFFLLLVKLSVSLLGFPPVLFPLSAMSVISVYVILDVYRSRLAATGSFLKVAEILTRLCGLVVCLALGAVLAVSFGSSSRVCHIMAISASVTIALVSTLMAILGRKGWTVAGNKEKVQTFKVVSVNDFVFHQINDIGKQDNAMVRLFKRVEEKMKTDKWYLDEDLSLESLSRLIYTNKSYLSKTINTCSSLNFRQYINRYRIMHALELMSDGTTRKMEDVASMSGFHSAVSFNMSFKLNLGKTPSEWLEEYKISKL